MSNALAITDQQETLLQRFETLSADQGKILKFAKGAWSASKKDMNGKRLTAYVHQLSWGWRKWKASKIVNVDAGLFADPNFRPKQRAQLNEYDSATWEISPRDGSRKDPWEFCYFLRLEDDDDPYTWATTSDGGERAIKKLLREFTAHWRQEGFALPVIELGSDAYQHPDFGATPTPSLKITGWASGGSNDLAPLVRSLSKPKTAADYEPAGDPRPEPPPYDDDTIDDNVTF